MYQIKELHSDTITESEIQSIIEFCDLNSSDSNYQYRHYTFEQDKNNWYTLMFKESRFLKAIGGLCVAYDGDDIVAISGYNQSDVDPSIFIGGVRTLKSVDRRDFSTIIEYLIPYQRQAILNRGGKCVVFLIETEKQASFYRLARNVSVRKRIENESRSYYTTFTTLDYPIHINNSVLNVVYEYLDSSYTVDWESLRAERS
jgi:hypothetical protein